MLTARLAFLTVFVAPTLATAQVAPEAYETASADSELPSPDQAELRLARIFERQANWGEVSRYLSGIGGVTVGPAGIGSGLYFMLDDSSMENETLRLVTGGALIGVGAMTLANGIYTLAQPSFGQSRLEAFRRAREDGLTERELGHFEGQLRLEAERGRRVRELHIWTGIGKLVGGGVILGATAASESAQGDRETGYVLGGVVAGLGALTIVKSLLCMSHGERVWQAYLEEEVAPEPSVELLPAVGPQAARLDVVGTF